MPALLVEKPMRGVKQTVPTAPCRGGGWTEPVPRPCRADTRTRVLLASQSPRRRKLLAEHGIEHQAVHPGVDDGALQPGAPASAGHWAMALAYLKAAAAHKSTDTRRLAPGELVVLGADTVVVKRSGDETEFIGQPRDAADAERILRRLANGEHEVVTGVALVDAATGRRDLFCDRATVRVGAISEDTLAAYLASGEWAGKAGAYNLAERIEAGWPIEFDGDPATIMGLPMRMLPDRLRRFAETSAPCAAA